MKNEFIIFILLILLYIYNKTNNHENIGEKKKLTKKKTKKKKKKSKSSSGVSSVKLGTVLSSTQGPVTISTQGPVTTTPQGPVTTAPTIPPTTTASIPIRQEFGIIAFSSCYITYTKYDNTKKYLGMNTNNNNLSQDIPYPDNNFKWILYYNFYQNNIFIQTRTSNRTFVTINHKSFDDFNLKDNDTNLCCLINSSSPSGLKFGSCTSSSELVKFCFEEIPEQT